MCWFRLRIGSRRFGTENGTTKKHETETKLQDETKRNKNKQQQNNKKNDGEIESWAAAAPLSTWLPSKHFGIERRKERKPTKPPNHDESKSSFRPP